MKLATTLFALGIIALILGLALAVVIVIMKIMAAKKNDKKTEVESTPAPVDTDEGDNKSAAQTDKNGEGTTSDKAEKAVEPALVDEKPCPEKGALAAAKNAEEKADTADKKASEAAEAAEAADKKAIEAAEAAKAAAEVAKAAAEKAEANAKAFEEKQHQERLEKNAEEIRLVQGVLVLKQSELAAAKEELHFANDDQSKCIANVKDANKALVTAGSEKNNALHKYTVAAEARADAEVAVDNATIACAGKEAINAAEAERDIAVENEKAAKADLQAATKALNAAKAAKAEADDAASAKNKEIVAAEAKISKLEKEIESLEAKLAALMA